MTTKQRISNIIEKWYLIDPLFFAVWTTHELSNNPNIQNIRVGRGQIEYNPTFIEALDNQTLYQVLRFEAMRIILKHPYLRRKENQIVAYTASNITIQEYLQTSLNFPYAKQIFQTDEYDKKYFEFYYYKLLEQQDSMGQQDKGEQSGAQEQYTDPETSGIENTESWDADEYYNNQINDKIESALENNTWGTVPSDIQELILATLKPKINYREILRSFRASIISVNRVLTRMKPSRRYGFLYLGSRRDFCTKLLFAVDVSGSVTNQDIRKAFSIINQLFKYGIERIDVLQFDSEIKGKPLTLKKAKYKIKAIGRGGTYFQPVIDYIDKNKEYDGLIIFTDGWAPIPTAPKNKRTRILWLFNNEHNYRRMKDNLKPIGGSTFIKEL
ncbi:MAG: VWA-like domain-containing protein [Pseudomonadota bacterium]